MYQIGDKVGSYTVIGRSIFDGTYVFECECTNRITAVEPPICPVCERIKSYDYLYGNVYKGAKLKQIYFKNGALRCRFKYKHEKGYRDIALREFIRSYVTREYERRYEK